MISFQLITILFGANDICSAQCYRPDIFSPARHAFYLRKALDFLKATLPRTVVNLVPTIGNENNNGKNLCLLHCIVTDFDT